MTIGTPVITDLWPAATVYATIAAILITSYILWRRKRENESP